MNFNSKILVLLLMVFLLGVNVAGASDTVNSNTTLSEPIISDVGSDSADDLVESAASNNEILAAQPGTFSYLQELIDNDTTGEITLGSNYVYNADLDSDLVSGIIINKSLIIHGNGRTVNGNGVARVFNIVADDVILEKVTISNGYKQTDSNGAGVYWEGNNGMITSCTFSNNLQAMESISWGTNVYFIGSNFMINSSKFSTTTANDYYKHCLYFKGDNIAVVDSSFDRFSNSFYGEDIGKINFTNNKFTTMYKYNDITTATLNRVTELIFEKNNYSGNTDKRMTFNYADSISFTDNYFSGCSGLYSQRVHKMDFHNNSFYSSRATFSQYTIRLDGNYADSQLICYNNSFDRCYAGNGPILYINIWNKAEICNTTFNHLNNYYNPSTYATYITRVVAVSDLTFYNFTYNDTYADYRNAHFDNVNGSIFNVTFNECRGYRNAGIMYISNARSNVILENVSFTKCHATADDTTLDGLILYVDNAHVVINNITVEGTYFDNVIPRAYGIIRFNTANITLTNSRFINNTIRSTDGLGIIYNTALTSFYMANCTFINSSTLNGRSGVLYATTGNNAVIYNNTFDSTFNDGGVTGVIYLSTPNTIISNNTFVNNTAATDAVITSFAKNVIICNNTVVNNSATGDTGAFNITGEGSKVYNNYFENNHADKYGVIYASAKNSFFYDNIYVDNYATTQGVFALGNDVTINHETFLSNNVTNGQGGTIAFIGNNNNVNNTFINDTSALYGGAVYNIGNNNKLKNVTINNTKSTFTHGGAIYSTGNYFTIDGLEIFNSTAVADGGAIYGSGSNTVLNHISMVNISAAHDGGAIFWTGSEGYGEDINITNASVTHNGGAINWIGNQGNLSKVKIVNSSAEGDGGAIYWGGDNGEINNLIIENSHASNGGAVTWTGTYGKIDGTSINNVYSTVDGGALYWTGYSANIMNIIFTNINSSANGGAIYGTSPDSTLDNLEFENVNASNNGGAIYWTGADSILSNSAFNIIRASANGGAIYWTGDRSNVKYSKFENIAAGDNGGAIYWTGSSSNMFDVNFTNCNSSGSGGAVYWSGISGNITNAVLTDNNADSGGAISWSADDAIIYNSTFINNTASNNGGAIYLIGSFSKLFDLIVIDNNASFKGGGLYLIGNDIEINKLTVNYNLAGSDGGALSTDGSNIQLNNSKFDNNHAVSNGGAINWLGAEGILNNVTLTNNNASIGGAVYWSADNANISKVTFINNTALTAGGLYMVSLTGGELSHANFSNNNATGEGGVIYWTGNNGKLYNATFDVAHAKDGGAIFWAGSTSSLDLLSFNNISADSNGGILYVLGSNVNVTNANFCNGSATDGGAIYWTGHNGKLDNVNFTLNNASNNGGAFYLAGSNFELNNANFTRNNASVFGGAVYLAGSMVVNNSEFTYNRAYFGSAIYNAGTVMLEDVTILNNKANVSYVTISTDETSVDFVVTATLRGNDNFLNGIWTVSNNIQAKNATYWGANGITVSPDKFITPISGVSPNTLYYDTRLAGMNVSFNIYDESGIGVNLTDVAVTDVYGNAVKTVLKVETMFNVSVWHEDDIYYTNTSNHGEYSCSQLDPTLELTLNSTEFEYNSNVTVGLRLVAEINSVPVGLNGTAHLFIDGKPYKDVEIVDGVYSVSEVLPLVTGDYNITATYDGGTCLGKTIPPLNSECVNFTIEKTTLNINVSVNSSLIFVGDNVKFNITGPTDYNGTVQYLAGVTGIDKLYNGEYIFNATYIKNDTVYVLVFAAGDDNYLSAQCNFSFDVHKRDVKIEFEDITDINVGDLATIKVKLNVSDATGNVIITVNGVDYNATVTDNYAIANVYYLPEAEYNVTAVYEGDNSYYSSDEIECKLIVSKIDTEINVKYNSSVCVGDEVLFNINVSSLIDGYTVNGFVTVSINDTSYNVSIIDGSGSLSVPNLAYGDYDVLVNYSGDVQFNQVTDDFSINVNKVDIDSISVNVDKSPIVVGEGALFNIEIDPASAGHIVNGSVTIRINNKNYNVPIVDNKGYLLITDLPAGEYSVNVSYDGDGEFNSKNITDAASIVVKKINIPYPIVQVSSINVGEDALINIKLLAEDSSYIVEGHVVVTVDDKNYNVSIVNGSGYLSVPNLKQGTYPVDISYLGNEQFNATVFENTAIISVDKVNILSINVTPKIQSIYIGENAVITVNLTAAKYTVNGSVTVNVGFDSYNVTVVDGIGTLSVPDLINGVYYVNVMWDGNDYFNPRSASKLANITVNKINISSINVTADSPVYVGETSVITINMTSDAYSVNDSVIVTVDNKDYTVPVINGIGYLTLNDLTEGNHTIHAIFNGNDYFNEFTADDSVIKVNKINVTSITVNTNSPIYVSQDAVLDISLIAEKHKVNGSVIVNINDKNHVVVIVNGSGSLTVPNLPNGTYNVKVTYEGDEKFTNISYTGDFTVNKIDIDSMTVSVDSPIYVGENSTVNITLVPGNNNFKVNGLVTVRLNNKSYDAIIDNNQGQLIIEGLVGGTYPVNITYLGDNIFNAKNTTSTIVVNKIDLESIVVNVDSPIYVGENSTVNVTLKSSVDAYNVDGWVFVKLDDNEYVVPIKNGTGSVTITGLLNGTYPVNVTFTGDDIFNAMNASSSITVNKVGISSMTVSVDSPIYVGESSTVNVTLVSSDDAYKVNDFVSVSVGDDNYTVCVVNGTGSFVVSGLLKGNYPVNAVYLGDDLFDAKNASSSITVNKVGISSMTVSVDSPIYVGESSTVNVTLVSSDDAYKVNDFVSVSVGDDNYTVCVVNGTGSFVVSGLLKGNYPVNAVYLGDDLFDAKNASSSITVNKVGISSMTVSVDSPIYAGESSTVNVTLVSGDDAYKVNDFVSVSVNGKNYTISVVNGTGSFVVSGLLKGTYPVNAVYLGDDLFDAKNASSSITVNKIGISSMTVSVDSPIYAGEDSTVNVTLVSGDDAYKVNDFVSVSIGDDNYTVCVVNGTGSFVVSGLLKGTYPVNAVYLGDDLFDAKNASSSITVNKVGISSMTVSVDSPIYVGESSTVNVTVISNADAYKVNDFVTLTVGDRKYKISLIDGKGSVIVTGLQNGTYSVNVTYDGNDIFDAKNASSSITVNKVDIESIKVTLDSPIYVGQNSTINISIKSGNAKYPVNGYVNVTLDNKQYNVTIINGNGSITITGLSNGTYDVKVSYAGDNTFNSKDADVSITVVNKISTKISMNNLTLNVGDVANITATINNTEVTGNVIFIVDNKQYIVGIVNGVATLNVTGLNTSANKTITAIYSGDYKFINSTATAILNISKVTGNASISAYDIIAGENENIIINLPKDISNATISVKFNDNEITDYVINNNVISFNRTIQAAGDYNVSIIVKDDCKYYDFSNFTSFTVSKVAAKNYTIGIDVNNTNVFEKIPLIITLPNDANNTVNLSVDGNIINLPVTGNIVSYEVDNLSYGNHTITVSYGNEKYADKSVSTNIFVSKINSAISIVTPASPKVGNDIIIEVIPSGSTGNITAKINGKSYTVEEKSFINASDLLENNYTIVVVLAEDENYLESTNMTVFTVTRTPVSLTLNDVGEVFVGVPVTLQVNLTNNVTGNVIFNINGENYTVNITESNIAQYSWTPASDGIVNVSASFTGSEVYYPNSTLNSTVFEVYRNHISFTNINASDIMVDDTETIVINLNESDATGVISISVNGSYYEGSIINGSAIIDVSGLNAGTYNVISFYGGDNKYLAANSISVEFNVVKYNAVLSIIAEDIMVLDDALIIVTVPDDAEGHISITVNGKSVYLPVSDGSASWSVSGLSAGTYDVNVVYSGDRKYLANTSSAVFNVIKYNSTFDVSREDAGWTGDDIEMSVKLSDDATGNVTVSINGEDYIVPVSDGYANFTIPMLDAGDYNVAVTYDGDNKYDSASQSFNFTVISNHPVIESNDVVKYYKGSDRLYLNLTNVRGDRLANQTVYITINGVTYSRVTNINGSTSIAINIPNGEYSAYILYNTSELYDPIDKTVNITVLTTIQGNDLVKVFCNDSQYWAHFTDSNGNDLANTIVTFNINGVFYNRMTNESGWAKLNINLLQGEYIITAYNPANDESSSNIIKVLPRIVENYDIVKVYRDPTKFTVRIVGDDGEPVGAGVSVEFNINGVFYTRNTNASGYAALNINLPQGEYIITTYYMSCVVSNTVTVLAKE